MSSRTIKFGNRLLGSQEPVMVIAEIGINHEGDVAAACKMVKQAAESGADAIKLQTADPDENYAPDTTSYEVYRKSFLGPEETAKVFDYAKELGLEYFTTTGLHTFEWVEKLNPSGYKISSGTLSHIPLIQRAARSGRSLMMSTGIASHQDMDDAYNAARAAGARDICFMQCTSLYPCPSEKVDLASIAWLGQRFNVPVGYSDHTNEMLTCAFSVAAGARFIEKHFSYDPFRPGFDHNISFGPEQFKEMVTYIREAECLFGAEDKPLQAGEQVQKMKRYLVASRDMKAGEIIQKNDVNVMRVRNADGALNTRFYDELIGSTLKHDVGKLSLFTEDGLVK